MKSQQRNFIQCRPLKAKTQAECPSLLLLLQPPEHGREQIDREQPDKDDLPESQIARRPVIRRNLRIAIEEDAFGSEKHELRSAAH